MHRKRGRRQIDAAGEDQAQCCDQHFGLRCLRNEPHRAVIDGAHDRVAIFRRRQHNDRKVREIMAQLAQQLDQRIVLGWGNESDKHGALVMGSNERLAGGFGAEARRGERASLPAQDGPSNAQVRRAAAPAPSG